MIPGRSRRGTQRIDRVIEEGDRREAGFVAAVEAELAEIRAFDGVVNVILDRLSELGWTREELAARADLCVASAPEASAGQQLGGIAPR